MSTTTAGGDEPIGAPASALDASPGRSDGDVYIVTSVNPSNGLVALRDRHGRCHAAHCTGTLPAVGEALQAPLPERGFTLLIRSDGGLGV